MRTSVLQTDKQAKFILTGTLVDVNKSKQDLQELLGVNLKETLAMKHQKFTCHNIQKSLESFWTKFLQRFQPHEHTNDLNLK